MATCISPLRQQTKCLQTSLKRMNTKYIDLYYGVHNLSDSAQLTDELRQWAKSAKERKLRKNAKNVRKIRKYLTISLDFSILMC